MDTPSPWTGTIWHGAFVRGMKRWPRDIRLVHGEEHAKQALEEKREALR